MRTFEPWEGSRYRPEGLSGVRVLILGESHYGDIGTEYRSMTVDVVRKRGQEIRDSFFTKTQKLVSGTAPDGWVSDEERYEFWERVTFYNFVQSFPGAGPRCRPTREMWSAAVTPFLATIHELTPQALVVLGKGLRSYLPEIPADIQVCDVQHPSSWGFQYEPWQSKVRLALRAAALKNGTQQAAEADH
jgi:hypothetical protein